MKKTDNRPLKVKALDTAINDLKKSFNRDMANKIYKKWECFHDNIDFKQAVKEVQLKLKK